MPIPIPYPVTGNVPPPYGGNVMQYVMQMLTNASNVPHGTTASGGGQVRPSIAPNTSPGGRSINPGTARIADMPGGMDYLAGFGPAPTGVNLPDLAPIIHAASLSSGQGGPLTHQQAYLNALQRFQPAANRTATPWTPANPYASPGASAGATNPIQAPASNPVPSPQSIMPPSQTANVPYHPSWGVPGLSFGGRG